METSIKKIYENYRGDIYYYLMSLTHNQNVAEDLTSEVFIGAIKSLPNFKGNSDIKTWLFSIARHKWYDYIRKEKNTKTALERLELYVQEQDYSIECNFSNKETIKRILELLNKEKEQSKRILLMRADGYSFCEIGKEVHISESSARVIGFRTRKKLKEILMKEGYIYE